MIDLADELAGYLRHAVTLMQKRFGASVDPITGDSLTASEHVSWQVQHIMRRWSFLGIITLATVICWMTRNADVLTWWNLGASYAALVIEGVTAMALINQTLRDAVVSRAVKKMEEEHGAALDEIRQALAEMKKEKEAA